MQKPPLLPTILMFLGVGVLCALGTWQLQRLEWKRGILNALETEYQKEAEEIKLTELRQDLTFKRGLLRGQYLNRQNIMVGPRTYEGKIGKNFYRPFLLAGGQVLFVNQGWVPGDYNLLVDDVYKPRYETLTGILKLPGEHNMFTPANSPEKAQWYYPEVKAMAEMLHIKQPVLPYVFVLEKKNDPGPYPQPVATKLKPNNNHLQYAFFWFALAGAMVVVYALRFLRKT